MAHSIGDLGIWQVCIHNIHEICQGIGMRKLITTLSLTVGVLLGSAGEGQAYSEGGSIPLNKIPSNLPLCIGIEANWHNCQRIVKYGNHTFYNGKWENGKKVGEGLYISFKNCSPAPHKYREFNTCVLVQNLVWRNGKRIVWNKFFTSPYRLRKIKAAYRTELETVQNMRPTSPKKTDSNRVISASSGSGFAVSSSGHVITNHHVIKGCQKVKIHHKGKSIAATIITFDPRNDLALLKGNFRPSTVFSLRTKGPELLQDVYVAGYPFGRRVSRSVKVTKGIISSLTGIGNNFSNIQIDAALQPGNSGGPILDDRGNVVGVAVARLDKIKTLKKFGSLPENTNFGIKTSVVRNIMDSSNVSSPSPIRSSISKSKLAKMISGGTYYLSCWMTTAQIKQMRSQKVMFQNLD
jgi:S1-C subfamily serine protease